MVLCLGVVCGWWFVYAAGYSSDSTCGMVDTGVDFHLMTIFSVLTCSGSPGQAWKIMPRMDVLLEFACQLHPVDAIGWLGMVPPWTHHVISRGFPCCWSSESTHHGDGWRSIMNHYVVNHLWLPLITNLSFVYGHCRKIDHQVLQQWTNYE